MSVTVGTEADGYDYVQVNKASWDGRAEAHAKSEMYNFAAFKSDPTYISDILKFDLPRIPSLQGLHIAHLQCHIGTDTLSLVRLGAASVVGLDFSSESLKQARSLADATKDSGGSKLRYVEGDVYNSIELLGRENFDMVFTGIGALCWIPSVSRWAKVVAGILKPGGRFFIREGHPVMWAIDDSIDESNPAQQLRIGYPYFEDGRPIVNNEGLVYIEDPPKVSAGAEGEPSKSAPEVMSTKEFNHGIGEILQALIEAGMRITMVQEHDSVPWNALPGRMEKGELSEHRLKHDKGRLPCTYTIQAVKGS